MSTSLYNQASYIPNLDKFSRRSFLVGFHPDSIQLILPWLLLSSGVRKSTSGRANCLMRCRKYWIAPMPSSIDLILAKQELVLPLFSRCTPQCMGPPIRVI